MRIDVTIALHHEEDVDEFTSALWEVLSSPELEKFNFMFTVEEKGTNDASAS